MTPLPPHSLLLAVPLAGAACSGSGAPSAQPTERLLIDGGTVVVMDEIGTILEGGAVLVEGDRIAGLFDRAAPRPPGIPTLDATGQLVIPGLINTHGHAAMSLLRGLADDLPLMDWLEKNIFPAEAELVAPDFVYWGTLLASIEMLQSGTTTFTDMYYFREEAARATIEAGILAVVGPHVIGFPTPDFATPEESLAEADAFMERYRDHPLLIPGTAAHALYTTPLEPTGPRPSRRSSPPASRWGSALTGQPATTTSTCSGRWTPRPSSTSSPPVIRPRYPRKRSSGWPPPAAPGC